MLSARHLRFEIRGGTVEPSYLDDRYADVARCLLLHYHAFSGRPRRELEAALAGHSTIGHYDPRLVAGLRQVIEESVKSRIDAPVEPRRLRAAVFALGRRELELGPETVEQRAAEELGLLGTPVLPHLYADLPPEKKISLAHCPPSTAEVLSRYNFRLLQGLTGRALELRIEVDEQARAVYRFARLHGLLVEVRRPRHSESALDLEITGPLSLFRRTRKYGRALARFLPACCTGGRYRIQATLSLNGREVSLTTTDADRVLPSHRPPRLFDSRLEERFFRDFVRLGSRWEIFREANLLPAGGTFFIPDFSFRLRGHKPLRVDMEIVGFWTRDYLARKVALASRLRDRHLLFCVDRRLACGADPSPIASITFTGRVPAREVLERLEDLASEASPQGSHGAP